MNGQLKVISMLQKIQRRKSEVEHWPSLNTVLMVENVLRKHDDSVISVAELKRKLPRQVNHNTLIIILRYLEMSNKIAFGSRGMTWVFNPNPILHKAIGEGFEL